MIAAEKELTSTATLSIKQLEKPINKFWTFSEKLAIPRVKPTPFN
jgi:hypothetical protein